MNNTRDTGSVQDKGCFEVEDDAQWAVRNKVATVVYTGGPVATSRMVMEIKKL